ncbi:MAG: 5-methylcytosine restriction system specificity protein McrC [Methanobacteriaceae archaeon]
MISKRSNNVCSSNGYTINKEIPIQNIYYMLSYAYNNLKINQDILRESVRFKNIYDLFGRILIETINNLVRRGFYREYVIKTEDTSNIKGKINISDSIKRGTFVYKKLNCQYDELSTDVLFNQIIKTTMDNLIRTNVLDNNIKKNLKKLRPFFCNVNSINLNKQTFKSLLWNKNNQYYTLPITICELIFLMRLPDDNNNGNIHFKGFIQSYKNEMANLFENFVFNFYKKELKNVKTHKPKINWNLDYNFTEETGTQYLPKMRTDIVLERENKQLIIDTKFYKRILSTFHEKTMLNSPNLYQIHTYVTNSDFNGEISGMLLYASLGDDIDYQFKINNNLILIKTLDLNQDWEKIDKRLKEIAKILF